MNPLFEKVTSGQSSLPEEVELVMGSHPHQLAASTSMLDSLIKRSGNTLFEARSIFPLDLTPDHLIIDGTKICIIYHDFFTIRTEHTILLNEVRDVDVEVSLITASLRILVSGPGVMWTSIENLHKKDALQAKHLIEGLLIARAEHCEFQHLSPSEQVEALVSLGKSSPMKRT